MRINDFTEPELEYYRTFCNFDEEELKLFELRRKKIPLEKCAEILGYEDAKRISARVNRKIKKMVNVKRMDEWIENVYWKKVMENR